jgi:uncharacterized membrane protein YedE/YeeE
MGIFSNNHKGTHMNQEWNWLKGGIIMAIVVAAAVFLIKPIGVSTQFVITDAMIMDLVNDDTIVECNKDAKQKYCSDNAYLDKGHGKYAKNAANPVNYSYVFVLSMLLGALISVMLGGPKPTDAQKQAPDVFRDNYGDNIKLRYALVFIGGILVLFGARMAGGCTSGHMISGMMQTSLSGYLFAMAAFATAIPVAMMMYKK